MSARVLSLIRKLPRILDPVYAKAFPEQYARRIGVRVKGRLHIYGSSFGMFGTEPWLITLGDNVHITKQVEFVAHDGGTLILRGEVPDLEITKPIVVGDNVYIGIRSLIMPGITIGSNVIIGAGSIVTRDIPDNSVAVGVPARVIKSIDEYRAKAERDSLHLGHLTGKAKEAKLKELLLRDRP